MVIGLSPAIDGSHSLSNDMPPAWLSRVFSFNCKEYVCTGYNKGNSCEYCYASEAVLTPT